MEQESWRNWSSSNKKVHAKSTSLLSLDPINPERTYWNVQYLIVVSRIWFLLSDLIFKRVGIYIYILLLFMQIIFHLTFERDLRHQRRQTHCWATEQRLDYRFLGAADATSRCYGDANTTHRPGFRFLPWFRPRSAGSQSRRLAQACECPASASERENGRRSSSCSDVSVPVERRTNFKNTSKCSANF